MKLFLISVIIIVNNNTSITQQKTSSSLINIYQAGELDKIKDILAQSEKLLDSAKEIRKEIEFDYVSSLDKELQSISKGLEDLKILLLELQKNKKEKSTSGNKEYLETAENIFDDIGKSFKKIQFSIKFMQNIEDIKSRLGTKYHVAWNDLYHYRQRIENLFVSKETVNHYYGNLNDVKKIKVRKRHLYNAGILVYEDYVNQLKSIMECNYRDRINVIESAKKLLVTMENLLYHDNTRTLEKQLKKEEDIETIKKKIFSHEAQK